MTVGGIDAAGRLVQDLHAPADDQSALQVPALGKTGELLSRNRALFNTIDIRIGDVDLAQLQREAQRELISLATDHVATYQSDPVRFQTFDGIVLSGHQPELFHPGVWYKNFALSSIASELNLAAINLVIDSEVCQSTSIDVLSGTLEDPQTTSIPFDAKPAGLPYESTNIADAEAFRAFPLKVEQCLGSFEIDQPLCQALWKHVLKASDVRSNLAYCLAAGRHLLETDLGLRTLEVPLSKVCQTKSFAMFAAHILLNLPRFVEIYNNALANYRTKNRLRSKTHPAPDLSVGSNGQRNRLETPFWIWDQKDSGRRPMFVAQSNSRFNIDDRHSISGTTPGEIADQLFALNSGAVAIRTRALITTMYARLVLGDLFIHGIGGAKYDAVTDEIVREFFGVEPPKFMTLSATCHLPVTTPTVSQEDLQSIEKKLRDIQFHPEQFLDQLSDADESVDTLAAELVKEKSRLFETDPPPSERKSRHQQLAKINESLRELVVPVEQSLLAEQQSIKAALARKKVLTSREYSFCLFPMSLSETLWRLCLPQNR